MCGLGAIMLLRGSDVHPSLLESSATRYKESEASSTASSPWTTVIRVWVGEAVLRLYRDFVRINESAFTT
jgi:hypothetical protein